MDFKKITWHSGLIYALAVGTSYAAPPPNDDISNAIPIAGLVQAVTGTTTGATVDTAPFCGTSITAPGVWYTVQGADLTRIVADTCTNTSYDSKISVYTEDGGTLNCVAGNDDVCGLQSEVDWISEAGQEYHIMVHGFASATGDFNLAINNFMVEPPPTPPANDDIENAITVYGHQGETVVVSGTTVGATDDPGAPHCNTTDDGFPADAPGVWYKVYGDGFQAFAHMCDNTNYDGKISVYTRDGIGSLNCIVGNDDACGFAQGGAVDWAADLYQEYHVLVHGFAGDTGDFDLTLSGIGDRPSVAVPTMGFWGLAGLAALLGVIGVRRRMK